MLLLSRRYLVLIALFFWQGGFTFYASVVVPVGQQVFGHLRQGFITQQVTVYLNLSGAIALLCLLWDLLAAPDGKWRRGLRWLLWIAMGSTLLWLLRMHGQLDELLVRKGYIIRDTESFHALHRLYLWVSTVQWACGLLYVLLTLAIWRREDRAGSPASQAAEIDVEQGKKKSSAAGFFGVAQSPKSSNGGT